GRMHAEEHLVLDMDSPPHRAPRSMLASAERHAKPRPGKHGTPKARLGVLVAFTKRALPLWLRCGGHPRIIPQHLGRHRLGLPPSPRTASVGSAAALSLTLGSTFSPGGR